MKAVRARFGLLLLALMVVGACSSPSSSGPAGSQGSSGGASKLAVVASTTVFADLVRNVGGDLVSVTSLVPPNGDVHTFSPKPSDIRTLANAKLVVMNGLGLDDWLLKTIQSVATGAPVLQLAVNLPGADYVAGEDPTGPANPHLWMDVTYGQAYVDEIAAALTTADPTNAGAYESQRRAYRTRLDTLDSYVKAQLASIPVTNRRFVAFHDAFPYYARRFGLTIVGVAVEAPGQDPSAAYTARLISAIRGANVKAIFAEAQFPPKLVQQLAQETGTTVVATLYDDSIGDAPITSYEAVIRWDTDQFVKALA